MKLKAMLLCLGLLPAAVFAALPAAPAWLVKSVAQLEAELVAQHGEAQRERARRGLAQVAALWRQEDGDAKAFAEFVKAGFADDAATLDTLFTRFDHNLEMLNGHNLEVQREFRVPLDLDLGPVLPFDEVFAAYDPWAHFQDDFFANRLAFTALLNFPLTTLDQRLAQGASWSRRQWAETRLAETFGKRTPADVQQAIARASADADRYIAEYNIWMHHLVDGQGQRLFPPGMKLLSHWNLRDEIKAQYSSAAGGDAQALARQRTIQRVMERIVTQEIPAAAVNNPAVDWNPFANTVAPATVLDADGTVAPKTVSAAREPDTRYARLLAYFHAERASDPYSPTAPSHIARRFEEDRQIPETRVRAMFEAVLAAPEVKQVAALIQARLGRPLEPFDLWYNGFRPRGKYTERELDAIVAKRYPTAAAYKKDMPRLLRDLGFARDRASYLAGLIEVDPARGSGHALGALMRGVPARLRTRVGPKGMDYKGYNIAIHEMGHNVEQTLSLNDIDYVLLNGVPNTAFTEALAFVFQNRDLELLGLSKPDAKSEAQKTLNDFWATWEIAGVALVDMAVWHWMYEHPKATAAQLREATVAIAKDTWNRWYAPVLGGRDTPLLAIYSHMINSFLYLPDYPLGHLIAFQIEQQMHRAGEPGKEFERMAKIGRVTPDQWMIQATGAPVGPEALLNATREALKTL